jgi:hypothetical protein
MPAPSIQFPQDNDFVNNLVLQRTEPFVELGGRDALARWFATGEKSALTTYLTSNGLLEAYLNNVASDISHEVDTFLDKTGANRFDRIVSIGPGNGLFELALFNASPFAKILLIDIENSQGRHQHGFAEQGSGYASLSATKRFLSDNAVPADRIELCNPMVQRLPEFRYDLLVSLLSMGFHYPCDDYAPFILLNANAGATVVIDKRLDTTDHGFDVIRDKTQLRATIDAPKHRRYFLTVSATTHDPR